MSTASESSPSRGSGLKQAFSKARRNRSNKSSHSPSIASEGSDNHGLRASIEKGMDRLKPRDGEHDTEVDNGGLTKLLSKGIGAKRRQQRQQRDAEQRDGEEAARGRSIADRGTLEDDDRSPCSTSPAGAEDGSSLITYESETESYTATPPPLSSHPSHTGYLTTSSPLVKATTLSNSGPLEPNLDGADGNLRASTFPLSNTKLAPSESTPELITAALRAPTELSSSKRSPSPVGRLRDAFNPRRGPSTSPERKSGGGLGGILQKDKNAGEVRRGSVASRIEAIFPDRQSQHPSPNTTAAVSSAASPERSRTAKIPQHINTNDRPQTPPTGDNAAPVIVNTPPTPTDASSPLFASSSRERGVSEPTASISNVVTSPSGNMISHRRVRSNSAALGPSKLSNITSAPLTPTPENGSFTPTPNSQGGFFSTVFSAAQNAANTLSNSIANTSLAPGQTRPRSATPDLNAIEDVEVETAGEKDETSEPNEEKELAVKTLGMGDLSLSHLGILEASSAANTPTSPRFPEVHEPRGRSESNVREDIVQNRQVTSLIGNSYENGMPTNTDEQGTLIRPLSVYEPSTGGDQTPPNGSVFEGKTGVVRSGSIRSAIGAGSRRKRGSSAATGTTIGAAIAAANASLAQPNATGSLPKLTGFAVASKKRNRDFHQLFRSVPDDDYLIEDYSCALQREILAHGRLYVSEGHLCFSSNIFGWVTTLVMSFDEIVSVEKRSTALVFKNGLMISTLHAKNIFASFTSRDSTYDLIVGIWKLGHPSLRSSLNGVRIEETGGGDKTEKDDGLQSQSGSESGEDSEDGDNVYDEDEDDEDGMSFTQAGEDSVAGSDVADRVASRKPSAAVISTNGAPMEKAKESSPTNGAADFPGPATHAPTECTDQDTHYDKVIADELIPAPLGKVYNMLFGPASVQWMSRWLTVEQKCLDFQMEDKKGLSLENRVRVYSMIKPLSGAIGPKQTKCIITETLDSMDLEKAISFTVSTQTPDVPSGNVFTTKTKYCLTWGEGNTTRMQMNCSIEWTGKSWLKGPIEKGANDGQVQYAKDIVAALKVAVSSRRGTAVAAAGKSKKKGRKEKSSKSTPGKLDGAADSKSPAAESWGLLEPLRGPLGPVVDIIKPLLSGNMGYGLLVGLLVAAWFSFGQSRGPGGGKDMGYFGAPERLAAYEEMWRKEESELWNWLEERVGMDRVHQLRNSGMTDEAKTMEEKLREERVGEGEVEVAMKVTEEKLKVLKAAVEKQKMGKTSRDTAEGEKSSEVK